MATQPIRIYLSHVAQDGGTAQALSESLTELFAREKINVSITGSAMKSEGFVDLESSEFLLVLLNPDYFNSEYSRTEIESFVSYSQERNPNDWQNRIILINLERWEKEYLQSIGNETIVAALSKIKPHNFTGWYRAFQGDSKEVLPEMLEKELRPIVDHISKLIKSGSVAQEPDPPTVASEDPGISQTIEQKEEPSENMATAKPGNQAKEAKEGKERKEEKTEEPGITGEEETDFPFKLENKAATDLWTVEDKLGYRTYARAITQPILDEVTKPPLTIAIQAPWGYGKTSLMRMIQQMLDPQNPTFKDLPKAQQMADPEAAQEEVDKQPAGAESHTRYGKMFKVLEEENENPEMGMLGSGAGKMHTIWFNPLYFHNSDQIWAGMAHAILQQLSSRLPNRLKIEEFWLRLRARRINTGAIRRDFHKVIFEKVLPRSIYYLIAAVLVFIGIALNPQALIHYLWAGIPLSLPLLDYFITRFKADKWTLKDKFEEYVQEPDYSGKLGFLHLMDHDIDRALELLLGKGTVVIFIDDLDRCHPDTISEIVLAINQFISLPHRRTIFVLGMDSKMVAAALEDSKEFKDKVGNGHFTQKSFGWLFLEKFIQLPFFIPHISDDRLRDLLKSKMESRVMEEPEKEEEIKTRTRELKTKIEETDDLEKLSEYSSEVASLKGGGEEAMELEDEISKKVSKQLKDPEGEEMNKIIDLAIREENLNPRSLIRFLNMSRLLRHIQTVKGMDLTNKNARRLVTRGAHLMLNWPEILLWMQSRDNSWTENGEKTDAVKDLEEITKKAKNYEAWHKGIIGKWGKIRCELLANPGFYDFLKLITNDPPGLSEL